jgi:hypothetical protein
MKQLAFFLSLFIFVSVSCKKDDNSNSGATNAPNILKQGNWRITLYNDSGKDETSYFTGYTFTFVNGVVNAVAGSSSVSGTYATKFDDSKNKLVLNFAATSPFDELNDDWHIVEETNTKIRLQDVSGGNGETDLLTFEKN